MCLPLFFSGWGSGSFQPLFLELRFSDFSSPFAAFLKSCGSLFSAVFALELRFSAFNRAVNGAARSNDFAFGSKDPHYRIHFVLSLYTPLLKRKNDEIRSTPAVPRSFSSQ